MSDWEDIQESLRLEEVLDDLGIEIVRPTRTGWQNTSCPLPTHPGNDKQPSFGINEDSFIFNCFACDEHGSLVKFVQLLKDISYDEALEYLGGFSDVETGDRDVDNEKMSERLGLALESALEESLVERKTGAVVLPYFDRGALDGYPLSDTRHLEKWGIWDQATVRAFKVRYTESYERGSYSGPALIIPHILHGELVGWQLRWLGERPDGVPKYQFTADFPREETIFNYDRATALREPVVVVESVMTVLRLHQLGITGVATFGAKVTPTQLELLANFDEVIAAYDNDSSGQKAAIAVCDYLVDRTNIYRTKQPGDLKSDLADLTDPEISRLISTAAFVGGF